MYLTNKLIVSFIALLSILALVKYINNDNNMQIDRFDVDVTFDTFVFNDITINREILQNMSREDIQYFLLVNSFVSDPHYANIDRSVKDIIIKKLLTGDNCDNNALNADQESSANSVE